MRPRICAVPAIAAVLLISQGVRAGECKRVDTTIVSTFFMPGCTSPVGVCTRGTIPTGPLKGTTVFTALSIEEGPSPELLAYKGELVITTKKGTVTIQDTGIMNEATGAFFEFQKVVGGTAALRHAEGLMTSQGTATGTGFQGTINGFLCGVEVLSRNPGHEDEHHEHGSKDESDRDGGADHHDSVDRDEPGA